MLVWRLDVAATAVAVVRVARAAGAVAVAGSVNLALNDDTIIAVVAVDQESQEEGNEEEDAVHDTKRPRSLEHGTSAVDIQAEFISRNTEDAQISIVGAAAAHAGAVCISDPSQLVHCADECADEEKVDKSDKVGAVAGARIQEQRPYRPCRPQHGDYEEDEDRARRKQVLRVVQVDEPGQHAQGGDEGEDLEDPPEPEGEAGERHGCSCCRGLRESVACMCGGGLWLDATDGGDAGQRCLCVADLS